MAAGPRRASSAKCSAPGKPRALPPAATDEAEDHHLRCTCSIGPGYAVSPALGTSAPTRHFATLAHGQLYKQPRLNPHRYSGN